ncbi:MAG: hypothetical protein KDB80_16390, partial [Planctomycetes bacterium]|nr:hypothetical protein [Planctomycetota bacterium]
MSTELIRRSAVGMVVAAVVATALWLWLARDEARADARWQRDALELPGELSRVPQVVLPSALPRGDCRTLTLATSVRRIGREVAPLVEVRRGGSVRVVRGAPAPSGPRAAGPWDVGVVLPRAEFGRLEPRERAALLEILRI